MKTPNNHCNGNFLLFLKTCRSNQVHSCHYTGAVFSLHRRSSPFLWVYFALFKKKSKIKPTLCPNSSFLPRVWWKPMFSPTSCAPPFLSPMPQHLCFFPTVVTLCQKWSWMLSLNNKCQHSTEQLLQSCCFALRQHWHLWTNNNKYLKGSFI